MAATPVGMKRFYAILAGVAVVGLGALGFLMSRPRVASIPANVTIQPSDTAGFRGYLKGSADAPVEITEYADYQCPFCQTFATLQMPTIEERLIKTGRLRWRYRDFPLQQHPFARLAAHSAACGDEQGKYWENARSHLRGPRRLVRGAGRRRSLPGLRAGRGAGCRALRRVHGIGQVRWQNPGQPGGGCAGGCRVHADAARGGSSLSGTDRFRRDPAAGGFAGPCHSMSLEGDAAARRGNH